MKCINYIRMYLILSFLLVQTHLWAQVSINGEAVSKTIYPHFSGFNNNMATSWFPWSDNNPKGPDRKLALAKMRTGNWRYPGGHVAVYWDHEKDRLFGRTAEVETSETEGEPRNFVDYNYTISWLAPWGSGLNPLYELKVPNEIVSKNTGNPMSTVWVLNLTTPGFDYYEKLWNRPVDQSPGSSDYNNMMEDRYKRALNMLNRAKNQGYKIDYIELGNEFYFNQLPSGTAYNGASILEPYIAGDTQNTIVGAFPGKGEHYATVANNWAKKLKQKFPNVLICVAGSNDNDGPSNSRRNSWNNNVLPLMDRNVIDAVSFHLYENVDDTSGNLTSNEFNLGKAFNEFNVRLDDVQERSDMPRDLDWWITEYNTNFRKPEEATWGGGLHSVYATLRWLERDPLKLIQYHQFDEASIRVGPNLTGTGRALSLLGLATSGCKKASKLNLNNVNYLNGSNNKIKEVIGWKFTNNPQNKDYYLLMNLGDSNVDFQLPSNIGNGKVFYTSSALGTNKTDPGEKSLNLPQNKKISLQKFSIYVVEVSSSNTNPIDITSFSINPENLNLEKGKTFTPNINIQPSNASNKNIRWKSNNSNIVSVDNSGKLTAVSIGETIITGTTEQGNFSDTIRVKVVPGSSNGSKYRYLRLVGTSTNGLPSTIVEIDWLVNNTKYPRQAITNSLRTRIKSNVDINNAWKAYDNLTPGWFVNQNFPAVIDLDLGQGNEINPTGIEIFANASNRGFGSFKCYGSNNANDWILLHSEKDLTKDDYPDKMGRFNFSGGSSGSDNPLDIAYKYLKLEALDNILLPTTIVEINWLSSNKQLPENKLSNNDFASSTTDSQNAFKAFDGKVDGLFIGENFPAEIVLKNPSAKKVDGISIAANAQNRGLSHFKCYGSNDNKTWKLLYEADNLEKLDYPDKIGVFKFSNARSREKSISNNNVVKLMKNPVNHILIFKLSTEFSNQPLEVSITSIDGRKLQTVKQSKSIINNTGDILYQIPIDKTIKSGMYLIQFKFENQMFVEKIYIKR